MKKLLYFFNVLIFTLLHHHAWCFPHSDSLKQEIAQVLTIPTRDMQITPLHGGTSAASIFFVQTPIKPYVLRVQNDGKSASEKNCEAYMMKHAAALGFGPDIFYTSQDNALVMMDFIACDTITIDQIKKPENIIKMATALRAIHGIAQNPDATPSVKERVQTHYHMLPKHICDMPLVQNVLSVLDDLCEKLSTRPKVMLHGDLSARNIFITDQKAQLIDWEASCWDDPFFDLAYFAIEHNYSLHEQELLLETYMQRSLSGEENEAFCLNKKLAFLRLGVWCLTVMLDLQEQGNTVDYGTPTGDWFACVNGFVDGRGKPVTAQDQYNAAMLAFQEMNKI